MLRVLAADHGLLVVLEDLHWSDPDTLTVLEYLADNITTCPVLIVITARDASPAGLAANDEPSDAHGVVRRLHNRGATMLRTRSALPRRRGTHGRCVS